jgi:hypothetical protein
MAGVIEINTATSSLINGISLPADFIPNLRTP